MDNKPRRVEMLQMPDIGYPGLDIRIDSLVRVLANSGYTTLGSCQGHMDHYHHPFPWVSVYGLATEESNISREICTRLDSFNSQSEVQWKIGERGVIQPNYRARNVNELGCLQDSAKNLADFLFNNYL